MPEPNQISAVVLAGGRAARMQQRDKGLLPFRSRPLVHYPLAALAQITSHIVISANRNLEQYQAFGYPVLRDADPEHPGPLAGIAAALAVTPPGILLVAPCDSPLLADCHFKRLLDALEQSAADIAVAGDGERLHPVVMALRTSLAASLSAYLRQDKRKIQDWIRQHRWITVDFSHDSKALVNLNTAEELAAWEAEHPPNEVK